MHVENVIRNYNTHCFMQRLKKLRGDRSNTEFATFLGLSRQTVGFYLNGDRVPDFNSLKIIAQKCQVPADYLLGLSDVKSYDADLQSVCRYTGLSEEAIKAVRKIAKDEPLSVILEKFITSCVPEQEDC